MPGVENWREQPLSIINNLFEQREGKDWTKLVYEYFESRLKDNTSISSLPLLNDCPIHSIQSNSLVRFKCMIQDTFDNEFFIEEYDLIDKRNGHVTTKTILFQELVSCPAGFEIKMDPSKHKTGMRQILYCVTIPGETEWVRNSFSTQTGTSIKRHISSEDKSQKRLREDDEDLMETSRSLKEEDDDTTKRLRTDHQGNQSQAKSLNKNHPLPSENGPVCLVKVYDESTQFKVNDVIEFIGIVSVDPELSQMFDSANGDAHNAMGITAEEQKAHHPPASYVPRLHVVKMRRMDHNNPLLPGSISDHVVKVKQEASHLRSVILALLSKATLGDELAAEYLLLNLISKVYLRKDVLSLGHFPINITGIPPLSPYPKILSQFLENIVTKSHFLPMTLDMLNNCRFVPVKNYETNRLDAGILQLSAGTHLILDETALNSGTMQANGIKNIEALKNVIAFQKIDYDFKFHQVSFDANINIIILSEGKSLLPCDCQVPLKPRNGFPENIEEYFKSFCGECPLEFLNKVRAYLDCIKLLDYQLPDDMMNLIQQDFVAARQCDPQGTTAHQLHTWLILGRLLSISAGKDHLTAEQWDHVKLLESRRKERLSATVSQ